ncbi:hypothetical protein KJ912_01915, partial [Patescibacteria group bacterium]|nr:hypothetical protein [Patescibacteria group bacterium]
MKRKEKEKNFAGPQIPTRDFYQVLEFLVYFGPGILVLLICRVLAGNPMVSLILAGLVTVWPLLKLFLARFLAPIRKKKDPRHALRSGPFLFDGLLFWGSPVLREIRKYGALSRSLDMIYNFHGLFGIKPEKLEDNWWKVSPFGLLNRAIKAWTETWMTMPVAQDVTERLVMVKDMIVEIVSEIHQSHPAGEIKILAIAAGTNQDLLLAVRELKEKFPGIAVKVVSVEPDSNFALHRAKDLRRLWEIPEDIFINLFSRASSDPESEKFLWRILQEKGIPFSDFDLVVCIGLGDYQGRKLRRFLQMLDNGSAPIVTANVSNNWVERVFLHWFIQWPKMQYLSFERYGEILSAILP